MNGHPTGHPQSGGKDFKPEIAIIEGNILTALGLKSILEDIIPIAVIRIFKDFKTFMDDTPDMYAHYFISSQVYIEHNNFFLPRKKRTIVLAADSHQMQMAGVLSLNVYQPVKELIKDLISLHKHGHQAGISSNKMAMDAHKTHDLSPREIDVITHIAQGLSNKEIANKLNISQTTVITHRKNITDKLGIKSVSGLTIYAVMNGYVDADRI